MGKASRRKASRRKASEHEKQQHGQEHLQPRKERISTLPAPPALSALPPLLPLPPQPDSPVPCGPGQEAASPVQVVTLHWPHEEGGYIIIHGRFGAPDAAWMGLFRDLAPQWETEVSTALPPPAPDVYGCVTECMILGARWTAEEVFYLVGMGWSWSSDIMGLPDILGVLPASRLHPQDRAKWEAAARRLTGSWPVLEAELAGFDFFGLDARIHHSWEHCGSAEIMEWFDAEDNLVCPCDHCAAFNHLRDEVCRSCGESC